ncbi:MAG: signal transduction histidine kinase [Gammaproteobacteria bacterium]|jgi:signal transduction histidine kinase
MTTNRGINQRILQAFLVQAALISIIALLGVYAARFVIGDILIQRALDDEASHYWAMYENDNASPRPDTFNLTGYIKSADVVIPVEFLKLDPGLHKLTDSNSDLYIVHVSEHQGEVLYLEFDGEQVSELALFFGIFPLALFLIVIYLSGWVSYRFLSQAVSPIIKMAKTLEVLDPLSDEFSEKLKQALPDNVDQEVAILSQALSGLSERIESFVVRERNFTRDASHELRSPITVIKIATDLLLEDETLNESQTRPLQRIKNNAADMEELIEALLILARESDSALSFELVCINDVVAEEVERTNSLLVNKPVNVSVIENNKLYVIGSDKVLSVMIGNLIRNAFSYTDEGSVNITISANDLIIEDSGIGIAKEDVEKMFKPFQRGNNKQRGGYGVGLTIVKMLSERFHWAIDVDSQLGSGTRVKINFPEASSE